MTRSSVPRVLVRDRGVGLSRRYSPRAHAAESPALPLFAQASTGAPTSTLTSARAGAAFTTRTSPARCGRSPLTRAVQAALPHALPRLHFPQMYWELVITARKFFIAFTALMFRTTPSYQLAMALLGERWGGREGVCSGRRPPTSSPWRCSVSDGGAERVYVQDDALVPARHGAAR